MIFLFEMIVKPVYSGHLSLAASLSLGLIWSGLAEETNVSTATIVRVARFLNNGFDGYKTIMHRQGKL